MNSVDVTNGDPLMSREDNNNEICDHRDEDSKESDQDGHRKNNNKTSKKPRNSENPDLNRTDAPKKSLSFFPSVEDSGESLDGSDAEDLSLNKNPTIGRRSSQELNPSADHVKMKLAHKSAVPIESDHDYASSTSSCSCEDHSSAGGEFYDDGHGDLDYDDDSITNSPIDRHGRVSRNVDISEPTSVEDTTNEPRVRSGKSNGLRHPQFEDQERLGEDTSQEDDPNEIGSKRPAKIRSFINHHRNNDEKNSTAKATKPHKDRSHKSYGGMLKYFFKDACFFQIKSINHENIAISKSMGVWSTPMQNEIRLNTAFREHRNVILIFSVQQSGAFQGFARMTSESRPATRPVPWVLPERLSNASLGGVFQVQWLCAKELNFNDTRDLHNPYNNDKPVKVARDGQQVEPKVGRKLCSLFPRDSKKRLLAGVEKLKLQTRQRKQLLQKRNSYYPLNDARAYNPITQNRHNISFPPQQAIFNGYEDMSISTTSQNYVYPNHHEFGDMRIPPRRRGPEHIAQGHVRRRHYPGQSASSYDARSSHYNPNIGDTSPGFSQGFANIPQLEFYPDHYGQHHQYPGPIPPGMTQPHSRSYYDWSMVTQNPARYHPYQRLRR